MTIEINNWQKDPTIRAIVNATFPGYRRRKVLIRACEEVGLDDLNWSGGTRSEYRTCTLDGQPVGSSARYNAMAPWDAGQIEGKQLPIPQGFLVVRGGYFCGKESLLSIYVNPADMPRYVTHAAA
jgi:hypothetical protein